MGSRRVVGFVASAAFVLIALVRCGTLESNGSAPAEAGTDDAPVPPATPPPGPPAPPAPPAPPDADAGHEKVIQVTAGAYAACALTESHAVYCWGANNAGVTGGDLVGSTLCDANNPCRTPTLVKGLPSDVVEVKIGAHGACARTAKGEIFCWGALGNLQLGIAPGSVTPYTTKPLQQTTTPDASAIRMRNTGGCVRTNDAAVWCWGTNDLGDLGRTSLLVPDGSTLGDDTGHLPGPVENIGPVDDLDVGQQGWVACAHASDGGAVSCWGWNVYDVLGHPAGSAPDRFPNGRWLSERPTPLDGGPYTALLGVGADFGCVREQAGTVACWGIDALAQHGVGVDPFPHAAPRTISGSALFEKVRVGYAHACGILGDGTLSCWGSNSRGELGDDAGADANPGYLVHAAPAVVEGLPPIDDVALGFWFTIALDRNGDVWAFGANYFGQLGHPSGTDGDEMCAGGPSEPPRCNRVPVRVPIP